MPAKERQQISFLGYSHFIWVNYLWIAFVIKFISCMIKFSHLINIAMELWRLRYVSHWNLGSFCRYRKALYFWSLGISLYLELFCFLSFITIVLRNLCSGTHRRNPNCAQLVKSNLMNYRNIYCRNFRDNKQKLFCGLTVSGVRSCSLFFSEWFAALLEMFSRTCDVRHVGILFSLYHKV